MIRIICTIKIICINNKEKFITYISCAQKLLQNVEQSSRTNVLIVVTQGEP